MNGIDKNMALEDLDFSVRTWKVLKDAGVRTLGDLMGISADDLMKRRNMGRKSLTEIAEKLQEFGLELEGYEQCVGKGVFKGTPNTFENKKDLAEVQDAFLESGYKVKLEFDGDVLHEISSIAAKYISAVERRGDLETRNYDGADFFETSVWGLKAALMDAYALGRERALTHEKAPVYCLCEEYEDSDAIREFRILATSFDKDWLRKLMEAKIIQDEYGFVKDKGVGEHETDHFMTNFDCGFVEYYIQDQKVLSREELEKMVQPSLDSVILNVDNSRTDQRGQGPGTRDLGRSF